MSQVLATNSVVIAAEQPPSTPDLNALAAARVELVSERAKCDPCWWHVTWDARELWTQPGVRPSSTALRSAQRRSSLFMLLAYRNAAGRQIFLDAAGGGRMVVFAQAVELSVLVPTTPGRPYFSHSNVDSITIPSNGGTQVSVTRVDAQIYPTGFTGIGDRQGRFTQRVFGEAGSQPTVEIPPHATGVQIFEDRVASGAAWEILDRTAAFTTDVGTIPVPNGASDLVLLPGNARQLRPRAGLAAATFFSIAYNLEW